MNRNRMTALVLTAALFFTACSNSSTNTATGADSSHSTTDTSAMTGATKGIHEEEADYSAGGVNMKGLVAYSDSTQGKRPAILVVHEWWGNNDYSKGRARQLAGLGYVAMAVDMYGNDQVATDPQGAMKLAGPFYGDPSLAKTRLDAALAKLKTYPQVDTSRIAAIGYCYGGYIVTNAAKMGADLKGVVSFHGDLSGVAPDKKLTKAKFLICHGEADTLVPKPVVAKFKKQMDSVGADYTFKSYPGAVHAFTNPASTANGKKFNMLIAYNEEADRKSWADMMDFLNRIFK